MSKGSPEPNVQPKEHLLSRQRMREILILSLLIVAVYGAFRIVAPYLHAIILAALFAYVFSPVHAFVLKRLKKRENLAAFTTCVIVGLMVVVPLLGFASTLVFRGVETFGSVQAWVDRAKLEEIDWSFNRNDQEAARIVGSARLALAGSLASTQAAPGSSANLRAAISAAAGAVRITAQTASPMQPLRRPSTPEARKIQDMLSSAPVQTMMAWKVRFFPTLVVDGRQIRNWLFTQSQSVVSYLSDMAVGGVRSVVIVLTNFLLMLFVMFYFFRDGAQIIGNVEKLSPLTPEQEQMLVERVQSVSKSAISGTLLTAIAQGILGMIAFAITGIPWLVWGVMLGFASLIPVVGTALVWVPCVIYLVIIGSTFKAIFLALWCLIVVGLVDNLLRPFLMQGKSGMSSMFVFFAILGGIQLFGLVGVIYGPLVFGLCAVMLYIFQLETSERQEKQAPDASPKAEPLPDTATKSSTETPLVTDS